MPINRAWLEYKGFNDPASVFPDNSIGKRAKIALAGLLKRIRAKALRKIGLTTTGAIYSVPRTIEDFRLYMSGKRVVLILDGEIDYKIGDVIRLIEFDIDSRRNTGRESNYFIKDIINFIPHISRKVFKVLTLE